MWKNPALKQAVMTFLMTTRDGEIVHVDYTIKKEVQS